MCTYVTSTADVTGSGYRGDRWFPLDRAAEGREVEEVVGPAGGLEPARVLRVGVEHPATGLQEAAATRHLEGLVGFEEVGAQGLELPLRPEVVLGGSDGRVDRDAEVVVEVGAERRVPGDVPSPLLLPPLELLERGTRDHRVARVP